MKKHLLLVTLLIIGTTFFSCKKKYTVVPPPTPTSSIHDSINFNRGESVQTFTVNGGAGGDFVTEKGIKFHIPYYSFRDALGDTVLGTVTVDIIEILDPSDMILQNRPTTSDNRVLVTGGQFKVDFTVNNSPVTLGDSVIYVEVPTDIPSPNMILFDGTEDATGFVNWIPVTDDIGVTTSTPVTADTVNGLVQNYYSVVIDSTNANWINCDYFYNSVNSQTSITLNLPERHNNTNTFFFIHFNDIQSVMAGYFNGDQFVTPGTIPVGSNVTLVIISEIDGNYYSEFASNITVSNGHTSSVTPNPTTYADMLNSIVNL